MRSTENHPFTRRMVLTSDDPYGERGTTPASRRRRNPAVGQRPFLDQSHEHE